MNKPFHPERLKELIFYIIKVIAPNCLALAKNIFIFFLINLQNGYAHLLAKVRIHFFYIYERKRAKQLRAHGKPWMQRVPYTFPLHNYPPNSVFFKKFFFCSFSLSDLIWIK